MEMGRREFMISAIAGLGSLTASPVAPAVVTTSRRQSAVFTRRNVYCMNSYSREIVAYKKAIDVMRSKPASDPTSWQAQSNIHGAFQPNAATGVVNVCPPATAADFVAPAGMIADACRHDFFFLAWHRVYLYYFERIVRKSSGDPTFALPYWGYSPGGQRDLPAVFRTPANTTNQLWTNQRVTGINTGTALNPSAVDAGPALGNTSYSSFQNQLSGTPHGVVHTSVGGSCGWMSFFETAGMDPVFWLHHCNIDRLWEEWLTLGGGRVNPTTNTSWLNQSFTFYDENGASVNMTVSQILDTATQLNYRYAAPTACQTRLCYCLPRRPWLIDLPIVARLDTIMLRPALTRPLTAGQQQQQVPLTAARRDIRVPVDAAVRAQLDALPRDPQAGRDLRLVIDDVRVISQPAIYYEVYVNLPEGQTPVYTSPHYIGNLDFFGSDVPQRRHARREFDLLGAFVRLRAANRWPADTVRVTLVPRAPLEGQRPATLLGNRTQATIGRISVIIE